jgi:O-antigen/teichoic acid export membrane protein
VELAITQRSGKPQLPTGERRAGARRLFARLSLTAFDQGLSSLSNFAVGVAVARIAGIDALGAYSLAYVVWLVLADLHRSLVTDPMAIENDVLKPDAKTNVRLGLAAELGLGLVLGVAVGGLGAVLLAAGQEAYGTSFVALAPWLPVLLVQDYWRWVGFMSAAPGRALANDIVFDVVQALGFAVLVVAGVRSSVVAIEAWGFGAACGALLGLWQFSVRPTWRGGFHRLRLRWSLSRWLASSSVTTWGASQAYVVLTGAMLGPAGLGGLRAALSLVSGPSVLLLQAGGSIGLPEASKALTERGWAGLRRVQRVVTAAGMASVVLVGAAVLAFGRQLLDALYGDQFGRFAHVADVLVLSVVIGTLSVGAVLSLKATKVTQFIFRKSLISLAVSLVGVMVLVPFFGVIGAAWSAVARSATATTTTLRYHFRWSRPAAEEMCASRVAEPPIGIAQQPARREVGTLAAEA